MAKRPSPKVTLNEQELAEAKDYFSQHDKDNNLLLDPPVRRAAYSDRMAWVLASMSQLAYDKFEVDDAALELLKVKLDGGGFEFVDYFNAKDTDTQAFLAVKKDRSYAVLAFRGTEKGEDIKIDATAARVSTIEGKVHEGFKVAYQSAKKQIETSLSKVKGLPLYITGHSLGAALATVATRDLERNADIRDQIAACYTYGSPRVGDEHFDQDFKSPVYRVVNTTDIVTVVPLLSMGYVHVGDVRFLENKEGEFRRGIPILQRSFFFFMALFRLFGPLVGDHAIAKYREKLKAIARKRNQDLLMQTGVKSKAGGR